MGYGFDGALSGLGLVFMGLGWTGLSILEPISNIEAGPLSKSGHLSYIFSTGSHRPWVGSLASEIGPQFGSKVHPLPPDRREAKLHASGYATESSDM